MKKLILIVVLSMGISITHGQEYKIYCSRISGCPIIDGTCPTCEIVEFNKTQENINARIERQLNKFKVYYKRKYPKNFFEIKQSNKKPSGWDTYMYPTWKGIRVLY